jgi:tetratricopeptide (TPR) repeat protein
LVGLTVALAASTGSIRSQSASAIVIEEVAADSPAAKSGFAVGDRVLMFDSGVPASPAAFEAAEEHTFNSQTLVQIQRGDATQTLSVPSGKLGLRVRPVFSGETSALYEAGRAAERSQRSDVAVARWTAAAEAARMAGESVAAAWLLGRVGDLHEGARRWKGAVAAHDSAWQIVKETGDPAAQSRVLMALGRSSQSAGDLPAALQWFERAVETNAAAGHEMWLASALNSRGTVANIRGNLALAQESYSRALSIRERWAPDSLEVAATLNGLGNVAFNRGDLSGATDVFLRALSIHDRLAPESLAAAAVLNNLGGVARETGDLGAAEPYQRR